MENDLFSGMRTVAMPADMRRAVGCQPRCMHQPRVLLVTSTMYSDDLAIKWWPTKCSGSQSFCKEPKFSSRQRKQRQAESVSRRLEKTNIEQIAVTDAHFAHFAHFSLFLLVVIM